MSLNPEPSQLDERADHNLPPKSYAAAAEEALENEPENEPENDSEPQTHESQTDGAVDDAKDALAKKLPDFGHDSQHDSPPSGTKILRIVPAEEFESTLAGWAHRVANGPTVRMGHIKGQLNAGVENPRHTTFREEVFLLALGGGEDASEAMQAYVQRREPRFTGR